MNPKIDSYLTKAKHWQQEMQALRNILLSCDLTEELKWGKPCYTFQGANLAILQGFKESCSLMFFKGALLKDTMAILEKPGENSQAARRIPFTSVQEILQLESSISAYIREAMAIEKAGLSVDFNEKENLRFPEELQLIFTENPAVKAAFSALTPGRQRAYNLYFSAPKQAKTRTARVEKYLQQILDGKGLND